MSHRRKGSGVTEEKKKRNKNEVRNIQKLKIKESNRRNVGRKNG
jgi:hypothetical protein